MEEKDPDWLFQLEKAIEKKYGKETVKSFKKKLSHEEKERIILESKELRKKEERKKINNYVEINGIYIPRKLIKMENYNCIKCNKFILKKEDKFFYKKYKTCETCFIFFVEDREDIWLKNLGDITNGQ